MQIMHYNCFPAKYLDTDECDFASKTVALYIKFNKTDNCYVIVVSLHEQKYPIKYCFK